MTNAYVQGCLCSVIYKENHSIIILFLWGTNKACFSKPQPRTMVIHQGFDAQDSTEVQTMTQIGASIGVGANFGPTKPKSKFILKYNLVKSRGPFG